MAKAEIDNDDYRVMPVAIPPIVEQRAMASHLDEQTAKIDRLIEETEKFIGLSRSAGPL